ncbi:MAG: pseudouridine synthase [Opitutales bacterium]
MQQARSEGMVRIHKFMADNGLCSRREAERRIADGRVKVNGKPAAIGQKIDPRRDRIKMDDRSIAPPRAARQITLVLNKPKGFLCSNSDPYHQRTVFDLVPPPFRDDRLFCAGRLDKDSEGLLVLTNNGDLANRLTHPSAGVVKRYRVHLHKPFDRQHIARMLQGIRVEGAFFQALKVIPATRGPDPERRLEIHLDHGKKREIRQMLLALGYHVKKLQRFQIGAFVLKGLGPGQSRPVSEREMGLFFQDSGVS